MTDPDQPGPTEAPEALDRLEEKVLGHRVDQRRVEDDDDPDRPADDRGTEVTGADGSPDPDGADGTVGYGAGSEPSG